MKEGPIPQTWIEAARSGFVDAWKLMASVAPGGAAECKHGLAMAATGIKLSGCNTVMAVRLPESPAAALEHARQFFDSRRLPWVLYASGDIADSLAPFTANAGLRPSHPEPAMFLLPEDARRARRVTGFSIQVVEDIPTLDLYRSTAARGFGGSEEGFSIWANPDLLDTPGLFFYLGLLGGEPVATSCVYALHGIATVNMVSTIASHRQRGFGEIVTWKAIEAGFAQGCVAAFLHASSMGQPVYDRMGFRHSHSYRIWTTQHAS